MTRQSEGTRFLTPAKTGYNHGVKKTGKTCGRYGLTRPREGLVSGYKIYIQDI